MVEIYIKYAKIHIMSHELTANGNGSAKDLSEREHQVLQLLAHGHSSKGIARELFIAHATARRHMNHIYQRLGATNRYNAVLVALNHGELEEEEVVNGIVIVRFPRLKKRPRLRDVLRVMSADLGAHPQAAEVASRLDISTKTAKNHQAAIPEVLGTGLVPAVVNYHIVYGEAGVLATV